MEQKKLLNRLIILSPYLFLTLICLINISWNITDHDDGHTLGYHAMGRNASIQRAYGAYDSMCDYLLSFLPVNYKLLLGCMVGATILASYFIIYFSGRILELLLDGVSKTQVSAALLLFLLAMPEYVYMIFSFKSVYISLSFVLGSFLLLLKNTSLKNTIISALIFGLGVSFRWNMLMMGVPVAVILFVTYLRSLSLLNSILKTCLWGILALGATLLFIYISGYPPSGIYQTYLWGEEYAEKSDFQLFAHISNFSLFFTPATALLFLLGAVYLFQNKPDRKVFFSLFISSSIAIAVISITPLFKFLAPLWLSFIALFVLAIKKIDQYPARKQQLIILSVALLIAFNWFVGIQVSTKSSNWGPGLNVKDNVEELSVFDKNLNTDNRFKLENISIGFHDGLCLPTSEGMRPLYGHWYALFCGRLKKLDEQLNAEPDHILERAHNTNTIVYQDRINPYLLASYLRNGYVTTDPWNKKIPYIKRALSNSTGQVHEMRVRLPQDLFKIDSFIVQTNQYDSVYLMFTFTSTANKFLYQLSDKYPYSYKKLGPMSAVIWRNKP